MDQHPPEQRARLALITGVSGGIGLAVARFLLQANVRIIGITRTPATATKARESLVDLDPDVVVVSLDLAQVNEIQTRLSELIAEHGAPDILVHNAGVTRDQLVARMCDEDWQQVLDVNLSSFFHLVKPCLRHMIKQRWGRIIGVSSLVGRLGNPGQAQYAAAKAGMEGFVKSLAQETAVRNISVNAVAPGFIETAMTEYLSDDQKKAWLAKIPMGRFGKPQEVAALINFLCSDAAAYISGAVIPVSGAFPGS